MATKESNDPRPLEFVSKDPSLSARVRRRDVADVYLENERLREERDLVDHQDDTNHVTTVPLRRLDRLQRENEDLKRAMEQIQRSAEHSENIKFAMEGRKNKKANLWKFVAVFLVVLVLTALVAMAAFAMAHEHDSAGLIQAENDQNTLGTAADLEKWKLRGTGSGTFMEGIRSDYLMQECHEPKLKRSFPDMDYALLGYNVLRGYPLAVGHDPGFTLPIFAADYSDGTMTADCRFSVPRGIVLIPDVSCITSFSSDVVESAYELSQSLEGSAKVSGGGWGVSFSASAGYKESSSLMRQGQWVFIISKASCNYYYVKLLEEDAPPFHPVFLKWVIKLNQTNDDNVYSQFFEKYGTHFLREAKFGASFTYEHKMKASKYKEERQNEVNVAVEASYSGLFSVGGGFSMSSEERQKAEEFRKKVITRTITIGAPPPANGDAMTWASTVKENPVPVSYELASMEELFTETFMGGPRMKRYAIDYSRIHAKMKRTKKAYCGRLMDQGLLKYCSDQFGVEMTTTVLNGYYTSVKAYSMEQCVDACYQRASCSAVSYCHSCSDTHRQNDVCFMLREGGSVQGKEWSAWVSVVIPHRIKDQFVLSDTAARGEERPLHKSYGGSTLDECSHQCVDDLSCAAFTFCSDCSGDDDDPKCKIFSGEGLVLFEKPGTSTHFESPLKRNTED
ncbi:hypothetical protein BaRGS_00013648 [Batillaria attramentaria]|uniref:MACPF domain-containing protein n=1 Tax=Batillaria attramentaria TaxID=370345 RepID=A0ABD0L6A5_9CAEN